MHFLIYSYNFFPEKTGIGKYNGEWAFWLASRGHRVQVITALPYYPEWRVHQGYRGKGWYRERIKGVEVYRCPMYIPKRVTGMTRILADFSFLISSLPWWVYLLFRRQKAEWVVAVLPPLISAIPVYLYGLIRKVKWSVHVQDLQVDAAEQMDLIRQPWLLRLLYRLERFLLLKADRVSSISSGMRKRLIQKGVPDDRYEMLENWAETDFVKPIPKSQRLMEQFGISADEIVVLYSGNLGVKQGVELLLQAAESLQSEKYIRFLICGEGATRPLLESYKQQKGLENVQLHDLVPYEDLPELLSLADIHVLPQKKEAGDLVLPSKLTGILAAGGFVIVAAEEGTTLHEVVAQQQLGWVIAPESVEDLTASIRRYLVSDVSEIRKNARTYAVEQLNISYILDRYVAGIQALL